MSDEQGPIPDEVLAAHAEFQEILRLAAGLEDRGPNNWFLGLLAVQFGKQIDEQLAKNGVTMDSPTITEETTGKVYGPYSIIILRKDAKSPAEWLAELQVQRNDLLAACKALLAQIDDIDNGLGIDAARSPAANLARKVIAKAEGESP